MCFEKNRKFWTQEVNFLFKLGRNPLERSVRDLWPQKLEKNIKIVEKAWI